MTDHELLEAAAKAAGILVSWDAYAGDGEEDVLVTGDGYVWNPLTDDGDALRLAVKLGIADLGNFYDDDGSDPYAATRLAITRAAAEIGRAMP